MTRLPRRFLLAIALAASSAAPLPGRRARAQGKKLALPFVLHAVFFSEETHQPKPLDPQVFIADPSVPAGTGPQNIRHAAGFRPAFISDPGTLAAHNADGKPLGFTLAEWFAARGETRIAPEQGGRTRVTCDFTALRPSGVYSLFENHFDQNPVGFTPLDGTGKTNTFTAGADGTAKVSVIAPTALTHANAVLLVYHSDGQAHGTERGRIGLTAHHQLIARIPA